MTDRAHWAKMLPIIRAFVDGKEVELCDYGEWRNTSNPSFSTGYIYRIKPEPIVVNERVEFNIDIGVRLRIPDTPNLRLTFDPDTKELLTAEVIK